MHCCYLPRRSVAAASKSKHVSLLDMKRANNIAITLSRFKVSNDEIKKAILTLDTGILDLDQLQMLLTLLPTSDEIKMLKVGGLPGCLMHF